MNVGTTRTDVVEAKRARGASAESRARFLQLNAGGGGRTVCWMQFGFSCAPQSVPWVRLDL
jgi:hypothetical protein